MKKLINIIGKTLIIFILYSFADIALMKLLPNDIKGKIYDKRTHKIKSYYYHHDLRPNAHWIERWGYKNSKIFTNNLGFKDKKIREINFKDKNILFIGDSFTEGVGVEFENTFVGIIEEKVTSNKSMTLESIKKIKDSIDKEMLEAVEFAEKSPMPGIDELYSDVYVKYKD